MAKHPPLELPLNKIPKIAEDYELSRKAFRLEGSLRGAACQLIIRQSNSRSKHQNNFNTYIIDFLLFI